MGQRGPTGKMLNGAVVRKGANNVRNQERDRSLRNRLNGPASILLEMMKGTAVCKCCK